MNSLLSGWVGLVEYPKASDALDIKIFYKKCSTLENCAISQQGGILIAELNKKILTKAAVYMKQRKEKNFKPYVGQIRPKDD